MIITFSESLHSFQNSHHHHHHKVDQLLCSVWVVPFVLLHGVHVL